MSDDRPAIEVVPLDAHRYRVVSGAAARVAFAVAARDGVWVFLDGAVHLVPDQAGTARRSDRGGDDAAVAAPMPATVVAVNTAPGATVTRGDTLIVLEAMKMELPIKAPRDGTVAAVACRVGELVQPGVPLVRLE